MSMSDNKISREALMPFQINKEYLACKLTIIINAAGRAVKIYHRFSWGLSLNHKHMVQ